MQISPETHARCALDFAVAEFVEQDSTLSRWALSRDADSLSAVADLAATFALAAHQRLAAMYTVDAVPEATALAERFCEALADELPNDQARIVLARAAMLGGA